MALLPAGCGKKFLQPVFARQEKEMQGCPLLQGTSFIMSAAGSIDLYRGIGYNNQALINSSMCENRRKSRKEHPVVLV